MKIRKTLHKYLFIVLDILLFRLFHIMDKPKNKIRKHLFKIRKRIYSNEINYKGHKILKSKLIDDYLSKISEGYISEKKT